MRLPSRVAVVTGGGGAMGGAQARLFAREGAAVVVADLFVEKAQAVAREIAAADGRALAARLDVQRGEEWARVVAEAEAAF
ncbi:MAG TPA: SDR family NAD(P)-dependent oxidoreductase, partial [Chloroflexota bacterium]|nr:SDR family NAD(P)-dependent oxidoreductase [Chloroflexota bacterium]